jgi:hypothetical protein
MCFLISTEKQWAELLEPRCSDFRIAVGKPIAEAGDVFLLACKGASGWSLVGFGTLSHYDDDDDDECVAVVHEILRTTLDSAALTEALVRTGALSSTSNANKTLDDLFVSDRFSGCKVTERLMPWARRLYDDALELEQHARDPVRNTAVAAGALKLPDAAQSGAEPSWTRRKPVFCRADPASAMRHADIDVNSSPPSCGKLTTAVRSLPSLPIQKGKKQGKKSAVDGTSFGHASFLGLLVVGLRPCRKPSFRPSPCST